MVTPSGSPLSHIESKDNVQGGKYCLKGARIPLSSIVESLDSGTSVKRQVVALKKYFKFEISEEDLVGAVREYRTEILGEEK